MIEITKEKDVQDYYDNEALSQSVLKKMGGTISELEKKVDATKPSIKIGSAVDCLLTSTKKDFESRFYVSDPNSQNVSDTIKEIVKLVYEEVLKDYQDYLAETEDSDTLFSEEDLTPFPVFVGERQLEDFEPYILGACEDISYGKTYKDETKVRKVLEGGSFFKDLIYSSGKTILTVEEKGIVDSVVNSLRTNPRTSKYFDLEALSQTPLVKVHYQYPIYFNYEGIDCKGLLDIVIFQYDEKGALESITPIDLKTMFADTYTFANSVKSRRYDIQALWYTMGLTYLFPEVVINPFQFVVESTATPGKPLVFEVTDDLLNFALSGDKYNPGLNEFIERYKFYKEYGFTLEKEIVEADKMNQPLKLDINGIVKNSDPDW